MFRTLREELSDLVGDIALSIFRRWVDYWIEKYGQEGFDYLVENDVDPLEHLKRTRPDLVKWVPRLVRAASKVSLPTDKVVSEVVSYLRQRGIRVSKKGEEWLRKAVSRYTSDGKVEV